MTLNICTMCNVKMHSSQLYSLCMEHMSDSPEAIRNKSGSFDHDEGDVMLHTDAALIHVSFAHTIFKMNTF